jgi:hypothetical protein
VTELRAGLANSRGSCGTQGGGCVLHLNTSRSDGHSTAHIDVLSGVISNLMRISDPVD